MTCWHPGVIITFAFFGDDVSSSTSGAKPGILASVVAGSIFSLWTLSLAFAVGC